MSRRQSSVDEGETLLRRDLARRPPPKIVRGQSVEQAAEALQRELLENLRRNLLSLDECDYLAAQLETYWFPASMAVKEGKRAGKKILRHWEAELLKRMIEHVRKDQKITKGEATVKVAHEQSTTAEAIVQSLKRSKAENRAKLTKRSRSF